MSDFHLILNFDSVEVRPAPPSKPSSSSGVDQKSTETSTAECKGLKRALDTSDDKGRDIKRPCYGLIDDNISSTSQKSHVQTPLPTQITPLPSLYFSPPSCGQHKLGIKDQAFSSTSAKSQETTIISPSTAPADPIPRPERSIDLVYTTHEICKASVAFINMVVEAEDIIKIVKPHAFLEAPFELDGKS